MNTTTKTIQVQQPEPRRRPRPVTPPLPVIGRAGTRERVRSGDAVFGGGEVR